MPLNLIKLCVYDFCYVYELRWVGALLLYVLMLMLIPLVRFMFLCVFVLCFVVILLLELLWC